MSLPNATNSLAPPARPRWPPLLIGVGISGLSLWLLLRQIDLAQVRLALAQAQLWLLMPAVALYFVSLTVRAWRWRVLVAAVQPISLRRIWPVIAIGYMGNVLLPARMGELLRAAVLARRGVHAGTALGTIATERMLDGLATVGILLLAARALPETAPAWLVVAMRLAGGVFAGGLIALWLLLALQPVVSAGLARLVGRYPWARRPAGWLERFLDGLGALRSPARLARAVGITLLGWAVTVVEYWMVLYAFRLALHPAAAAFSVSGVGLSTAIPAAPGYVGTHELAGVTMLGLFGVPVDVAFGASITFHLVEMAPIALVGLFLTWREGLWGWVWGRRTHGSV